LGQLIHFSIPDVGSGRALNPHWDKLYQERHCSTVSGKMFSLGRNRNTSGDDIIEIETIPSYMRLG
jgi:hypothetical protein